MYRDMTDKSGKTSREVFPDVLRIAATLAVVCMHTLDGLYAYAEKQAAMQTAQITRTAMQAAGAGKEVIPAYSVMLLLQGLEDMTLWCVPIFLMLSGYFLLDPRRELPPGKIYGKHCLRILLALCFFGIPYALLELVIRSGGFRPEMILQAVWNTCLGHTWSHMWYLYLILILYALTPGIRYILLHIHSRRIYGIMGGIVIFCSILPYIILLFTSLEGYGRILWGTYLFYYISGYLFHMPRGNGKGKKEADGAGRKTGAGDPQAESAGNSGRWMLMAAAVILLLVGGSRLLIRHRLLWRDYAYPPMVLVSLLIFMGVRQCFKGIRGEKLRGLSDLCFGVYLIHPVFLNIIFKGGLVPEGGHLLLLWGVLIYMAALLGAGAVTRLLRKVPFMRRYVL